LKSKVHNSLVWDCISDGNLKTLEFETQSFFSSLLVLSLILLLFCIFCFRALELSSFYQRMRNPSFTVYWILNIQKTLFSLTFPFVFLVFAITLYSWLTVQNFCCIQSQKLGTFNENQFCFFFSSIALLIFQINRWKKKLNLTMATLLSFAVNFTN
jgi:hypothetical protein